MWKIAFVHGADVRLFSAEGERKKTFPNFAIALAALLKEGYEPFHAAQGEFDAVMWLRLLAEGVEKPLSD